MYKRIDENHTKIVKELRDLGFSVASLATVGNGCPDIIVGKDGHNWLFEIKNPEKPESKQRLTECEYIFFENWRGNVGIVKNTEDALHLIRQYKIKNRMMSK